MAAIGLVSLKYVDVDNAYRRQLAAWYRANFAGHESIRTIPLAPDCESSCHLFQLRLNNRDQVMVALNEHDVYPGVHYRDNTEYRMYQYGHGTCPRAALVSNEIISMPMHMGLTKEDVDMISGLIIKYAA